MKLRFMKKEEILKATKLYCKIWQEEKFANVRKYFKEKVKKKESYVALENKKIIGILGFSKNFFKKADYLDEVVVDKKFRNKGIATVLIKKFEENAKKRRSRRIFSSTEPNNKLSIRMHKKLNYRNAGYIDDMWEEKKNKSFFQRNFKIDLNLFVGF